MARLWVQQIRLGKKTIEQVPRLLKDQVSKLLMEFGQTEAE